MAGSSGNLSGWRGSPWRIALWAAAAGLLLLPAVAMQFTNEVAWGPGDFVVFGVMLAAACGTFELAARLTGSPSYRAGVGVAVAAGFLLVWINLAVGIIGDEGHPANLLFGGVLAVAVVGAAVARFRPRGMARAMAATALAQGLVAVIAVAAGWGEPRAMAGITALFVALWLGAAGLFARARHTAASTAR